MWGSESRKAPTIGKIEGSGGSLGWTMLVSASHLGQNRGFLAKAAASCCCRAPLTQHWVPPGLCFCALIALANFHPVLLVLLITWHPARGDVHHCLHPYFSSSSLFFILILVIFNIWVWGLHPSKLAALFSKILRASLSFHVPSLLWECKHHPSHQNNSGYYLGLFRWRALMVPGWCNPMSQNP